MIHIFLQQIARSFPFSVKYYIFNVYVDILKNNLCWRLNDWIYDFHPFSVKYTLVQFGKLSDPTWRFDPIPGCQEHNNNCVSFSSVKMLLSYYYSTTMTRTWTLLLGFHFLSLELGEKLSNSHISISFPPFPSWLRAEWRYSVCAREGEHFHESIWRGCWDR